MILSSTSQETDPKKVLDEHFVTVHMESNSRSGSTYFAECVCGWMGMRRTPSNKNQCKNDGRSHLLEKMGIYLEGHVKGPTEGFTRPATPRGPVRRSTSTRRSRQRNSYR